MGGAIPPLPDAPSWHGAKLKLRTTLPFYMKCEDVDRIHLAQDSLVTGSCGSRCNEI